MIVESDYKWVFPHGNRGYTVSKSKSRALYHSAQEAVSKRHSVTNSWRVVSDELGGLNRGYLSKVARGSARASDYLIGLINEAYGQRLPFNSKPATPCARCGNVHVTKRCTASAPKYAPHPVMRRTVVDRGVFAALGALYVQRGIGDARYRLALRREMDGMTGLRGYSSP